MEGRGGRGQALEDGADYFFESMGFVQVMHIPVGVVNPVSVEPRRAEVQCVVSLFLSISVSVYLCLSFLSHSL